jgi:hypothetical protein
VIWVMTQGPGTLTGRTPLSVSSFLPGSVTLNVLESTSWMTGVVCQRLLAHARTTISGLASHGWWQPLLSAAERSGTRPRRRRHRSAGCRR